MGERLGRYAIIHRLAAGGMGEIYLAEHTGLSGFAKRVAVKQIKPELASNPSYLDLFLNEARLGSFLNHPNIVHIFDVGHESEALWLVMEYVDGIDLKRLLRRARLGGDPLSPITLAAVMIEVLSALEEAHAGGPLRGEPIIHRDLSPENILIARSGAVKVLDFGLAKWWPGASSVPSMEGNLIFGKIRYMPPEQLKGQLIDVRADLFALGVVMYEALANRLPFGSESADSVLAAILGGRPPRPTADLPRSDPKMDALIHRALEPDPERRFQTAAQMRQALVDYLAAAGETLPLEQLRRRLLPGAADAMPGVPSESAHAVPTEIGLKVAKRCGKCGGRFTAHFHDGLILDRCLSCRGVWFDHAEVQRFVGGLRKSEPPAADVDASLPAPLDPLLGSCPSCRVGLRAFAVPNEQASLEVCPRCLGVWFDRGETTLLDREPVVAWLRGVLDTLRPPRP